MPTVRIPGHLCQWVALLHRFGARDAPDLCATVFSPQGLRWKRLISGCRAASSVVLVQGRGSCPVRPRCGVDVLSQRLLWLPCIGHCKAGNRTRQDDTGQGLPSMLSWYLLARSAVGPCWLANGSTLCPWRYLRLGVPRGGVVSCGLGGKNTGITFAGVLCLSPELNIDELVCPVQRVH